MRRTWVGLGLGAACGFAIGVALTFGVLGWGRIELMQAAVLGAILAGTGAATGAIVGGVKDILSAVRAASGKPIHTSDPEADYDDKPPAG